MQYNKRLEWKNIEVHIDMDHPLECLICETKLPEEYYSPWSLCFNELPNPGGPDFHDIKGYFCQSCAEKLLKKIVKEQGENG